MSKRNSLSSTIQDLNSNLSRSRKFDVFSLGAQVAMMASDYILRPVFKNYNEKVNRHNMNIERKAQDVEAKQDNSIIGKSAQNNLNSQYRREAFNIRKQTKERM